MKEVATNRRSCRIEIRPTPAPFPLSSERHEDGNEKNSRIYQNEAKPAAPNEAIERKESLKAKELATNGRSRRMLESDLNTPCRHSSPTGKRMDANIGCQTPRNEAKPAAPNEAIERKESLKVKEFATNGRSRKKLKPNPYSAFGRLGSAGERMYAKKNPKPGQNEAKPAAPNEAIIRKQLLFRSQVMPIKPSRRSRFSSSPSKSGPLDRPREEDTIDEPSISRRKPDRTQSTIRVGASHETEVETRHSLMTETMLMLAIETTCDETVRGGVGRSKTTEIGGTNRAVKRGRDPNRLA